MSTNHHASTLLQNLSATQSRIAVAASTRLNNNNPVRLVAVSKLKPASDIQILYEKSQHVHFGENYVQELIEKSQSLPTQIRWHFIGQLQTNKCRKLAQDVPNLWAVESVDSIKKADALERGRAELFDSLNNNSNSHDIKEKEVEKLRVFIQVNTSGETTKSGCPPSETLSIGQHILNTCPHLKLHGLMTIGSTTTITCEKDINKDFLLLKQTAEIVSQQLGGIQLELSMGMSNDFEHAIELGSTNVRVGTSIFGQRPQKPLNTDLQDNSNKDVS